MILAATAAGRCLAEIPAADFSLRLDALWNFENPAASEEKFRTELARHPAGSREALETATQIARTQGLRRQWTDADRTLDAVAGKLDAAPARVRVRYLLERGRTRNSSGDKKAAVVLFREALAASAKDKLPEADYYRVDALHMLGIATPVEEQLDWDRQALAAAQASSDARTRRWTASLLHNIGWTYFDRGDAKTALTYWQRALPLREAAGDVVTIRVAKWTIARGQRELGQLADAERTQRALAAETEAAGTPDGYVYEELAEIAIARGDLADAAQWSQKAYALLKDDADYVANEPARLARLAERVGGQPPSVAR
jgi:tetratricopeptide (TPR) repeat protein